MSVVTVSTADRVRRGLEDDIEGLITRIMNLSKAPPARVDAIPEKLRETVKNLRLAQQKLAKAIIDIKE